MNHSRNEIETRLCQPAQTRWQKICPCLLVILTFLFTGCPDSGSNTSQAGAGFAALKPELTRRIATVSYPLQYLTQRIAGEEFDVEFGLDRLPSQQNWQPDPSSVAKIQTADCVITNGPAAIYADWLYRVTIDDSKVVKSCSDLATDDFVLVNDHKIVHQHGPEGEHSHPFMVAHSWLDPAIAKKQGRTILTALNTLYPESKSKFEANFESLVSDLEELSNDLDQLKKDGGQVISINPTMKFLTRAAGVDDQHLLWFDASTPEGRTDELKAKRDSLERDSLEIQNDAQKTALLIPAHGDYGLASALGAEFATELGLTPIMIDTLDAAPTDGDYLTVMKANIQKLKQAVETSGN